MSFVNRLKGYTFVFTTRAEKDLLKLDASTATAIKTKLKALVSGEQNLDVKKIVGKSFPTYRLRVGTYRILYEVHQKEIIVSVIRVAHRKEVYEF